MLICFLETSKFYYQVNMEIKQLKFVTKSLDEAKAEELKVFQCKDDYSFKYVVIAMCNSAKHASACCNRVAAEMKKIEGIEVAITDTSFEPWSTINLGDSIVHLLSPDANEKYRLEQLMAEMGHVEITLS